MYTRLIQGYEAMDSELQAASAFAARQLRLMVSRIKNIVHYHFLFKKPGSIDRVLFSCLILTRYMIILFCK